MLPAFEALQSAYTCKPHLAATREGRALQRVSDLVATLAQHSVDSRAALLSAWRRDGALSAHALLQLSPAHIRRTVVHRSSGVCSRAERVWSDA